MHLAAVGSRTVWPSHHLWIEKRTKVQQHSSNLPTTARLAEESGDEAYNAQSEHIREVSDLSKNRQVPLSRLSFPETSVTINFVRTLESSQMFIAPRWTASQENRQLKNESPMAFLLVSAIPLVPHSLAVLKMAVHFPSVGPEPLVLAGTELILCSSNCICSVLSGGFQRVIAFISSTRELKWKMFQILWKHCEGVKQITATWGQDYR